MSTNNQEKCLSKMDKSMMSSWILNLIDRYQVKGLCPDEEKAFIKKRFLGCAEGRFLIDETDLKYLEDKINIMYN